MVIAARTVAVDVITAEVVGALTEAGIPSLLMKGPVVAGWLYPEGGRSYLDTDLLVPPEGFATAQSVLTALGFSGEYDGFAEVERPVYAVPFQRRRPADPAPYFVDLHHGLAQVPVSSSRVWAVMSTDADRLVVAGCPAMVPSLAARAMHVAFHAAQHGVSAVATSRPMEDLRRALATASIDLWATAAALSNELDAEDLFATGLRLLPEGAQVAHQLDLTRSIRPIVRLASERVKGANVIAEVASAPTRARRSAILLRTLAPSSASMRRDFPIARRGTMGLVVAHLIHQGRIVRNLGPAVGAWRRAQTGGDSHIRPERGGNSN
jgi:hypothetical protein